jgi:hypothetical protein
VLLGRILARDFLAFDDLDLAVGPGLTVITGPNGVGKTNLGRCLDLARAVVAQHAGDAVGGAVDLFQSAGRNGATAFRVALDLTLDQPWERQLVLTYFRAAYACGRLLDQATTQRPAAAIDAIGRARLTEESLALLWSGTLHLRYDAGLRTPWFSAWEFQHGEQICHITLGGSGAGELRGGPADAFARPRDTTLTLAGVLTSSIPGLDMDSEVATDPQGQLMDLGNTLPSPETAISMHMTNRQEMSSPIPPSLLELAAALGVSEFDRYAFEFVHVFWEILRRQTVLTDNRRIPFKRRFTHATFDRPLDLRDGSDIPAELFRLKNGDAGERRRYAEIKTTFCNLTQRTLGLRSRLEPPHVSPDGLIVEPVIVTHDSEHLIEFAGAGAQEALVLSALLPGQAGRLIVLDEPAVNLEPTMQRRLIAMLRNTGQCLIITHSPDLVPVDQPDDLANIVRLAPTAAGARPMRANPISRKSWARWFKLLEPTHVRALLFASRVILCEGPTEVGALGKWWRNTSNLQLPTPEAANIPLVSVNGDNGFGGYIEYLDAFGIPWAAIADGPALRPGSVLAKQLRDHGHEPSVRRPDSSDFAEWRAYWAATGVFALADQFGDDGNKQGEFEAFLQRVDAGLLASVQAEIGHRSKPQLGALLAAGHPAMPAEVAELYRAIMRRLALPS